MKGKTLNMFIGGTTNLFVHLWVKVPPDRCSDREYAHGPCLVFFLFYNHIQDVEENTETDEDR